MLLIVASSLITLARLAGWMTAEAFLRSNQAIDAKALPQARWQIDH